MAEYQDSQCYVGLKESDLYILTEFFKVLGNPARIRILLLLMEQDANGSGTHMIANMGKEGKHISMDTLARICETLDCGIMDVIELASDEPSATGGNDNGKTERKNHREQH